MKIPEEYTIDDVRLSLDSITTGLPSHRRLRSITPNFDNLAFEADSNTHDVEMKAVVATGELDLDLPYNPHDLCSVKNPTSFWGTVFHTIILMAGPGVLSIPTLFVGAGYLPGAILMPCLFCLYIHTANMFMWSEYQLCKMMKIPTLPYPQVAYYAFEEGPSFSRWFSKWGRRLSYVDFFIVWYSYYLYNYVIVCQNLQVLFRNMFYLEISYTTFLEIITIPMLLLACVPKLKYLVPVSFLGMITNGLSLVLIVYFVFSDNTAWHLPPMIGYWRNIPILIGSVLININISGMLITLKNELKEPHRFSSTWFSVIAFSFIPTSLLYTAFSLICALKYGDTIKPSVIQNLPQNDLLAQIGIGLSSIAIICQQPLILVVTYDIVWNQILKNALNSEHPLAWEYVLRIVLVFLAFIISMALPNIFLFISMGGTVGTSIDSLILPAAINTIIKWKVCGSTHKQFWFIFAKNMLIIFLAVVLAIIGCIDCVDQIENYYFHES